MQGWIAGIFIELLTRFASWAFSKGLQHYHGEQEHAETDRDIDARLKLFKDAYKEAFNGEPLTTEQKKKLNYAISDFLRGGPDGGL